jgi:hypothetical protein
MSRKTAIGLAVLKSVLIAVGGIILLGASGQDPAGSAMGAGMIALLALYGLAIVLPAYRLAQGTRPGTAIALLTVPDALISLLLLIP